MISVPESSDQCNQTGVRTAGRLAARGFSFAPAQGKRPALTEWRQYQTCAPDTATINGWIDASALEAGIGVFSGPGGLITLDFDNAETMRAFEQFAPALASVETYRERTPRGGAHWFFLTTGQPPRTRKIDGGELRGAGAWTVIAPSPGYVQTGGSWDALYRLTSDELRLIEAFFTPQHDPQTATARSCETTPDALIQQYRRMRQTTGRNDSLFSVATWGRDQGFSQATVETALIDAFAHDAGAPEHRPQTIGDRRTEAESTITSAYSRPARQERPSARGVGLPNAIRERLMQRSDERDPESRRRKPAIPGGEQFARMYELLMQNDTGSSAALTECQIAELLRGHMGRNSIRRGLQTLALILDGFFSRHARIARETDQHPKAATNMRLSGGQIGTKLPGRPARAYRLPTFDTLAFFLGLPARRYAGDVPEAMTTAKAYRRALHAALIRRRPGRYTVRFLAERIGVCRRTIRRYNRELGVIVEMQTDARRLDASAAARLPIDADDVPMGVWIQIGNRPGTPRYPPVREKAEQLLATLKVAGVFLVAQLANWYRLEAEVWA